MAFCSSCGANVGDAPFCSNCGAPINKTDGGTASPIDNTCIRCGANLQNGICLSCGWSSPVQQVQQQNAPPVAVQAVPATMPINVTVNAPAASADNSPSGPPCPKCKSQSTELASVKSKKLSGGKIAAGVMTGGLSLLATGVSNKQKVNWVCKVCGHSFTVKG